MPPPNITGKLHMGHALFATLQDIQIRFQRMRGRAALWLPGTDHAGLATQEKLDALMLEQGLDPKGPEFDAFAETYKQNLGGEINEQLRRTGASCDWSRYTFTLDDRYSTAIIEALRRTHEYQMLYKADGQWYLDMRKGAERLLGHMDNGDLEIIPANEGKTLRHFLDNIEPWCISRQIRWGHKLPIWTNGDEIMIAEKGPEGWSQEEGCLDTWFSSALWPFATLGWPEETEDFKRFYPAAMIETADDILFFWCARMLMMGLILTDRLPFKQIYLHGIMRDKQGRKMSKSLGNGIDPLEIIDQYGCDAMRFALAEATHPGQDMKMWMDKFQAGKAMSTKLWNAAKFALMNRDRIGLSEAQPTLQLTDIALIELLRARKTALKHMISGHEYSSAAILLRQTLFNDFCGEYLESIKLRLYEENDQAALWTLIEGLKEMLILLHPIMPFITERLWREIDEGQLINQCW